MTTWAPAQK
ncbi:hypothetical protein EYF80_046755 [Liparis tanakae]|uniref:Uncharacterized protein n=1 Tax=Liparis tanakae TaxID=230148 RepID=A0A4Z2FQ50_9TELE|nr:hypothetical protein EYF80_046755 [Liparis tanakae]